MLMNKSNLLHFLHAMFALSATILDIVFYFSFIIDFSLRFLFYFVIVTKNKKLPFYCAVTIVTAIHA